MTPTATVDRIAQAERDAEAAAAKAAKLRAERDAEQAAERDRVRRGTEAYHCERRLTLDTLSRSVDQAWEAFTATVRDGGDVVGAYLNWRKIQATALVEGDHTRGYFRVEDDKRIRASIAEHEWLTRTCTHLEGGRNVLGRAPEVYDEQLAEYNRRRAAYEGITLDDDAPLERVATRSPQTPDSFGPIYEREARQAAKLTLSDAITKALDPVLDEQVGTRQAECKQRITDYLETYRG
jgi:hypothetical protein